jgi:hypothetical protein
MASARRFGRLRRRLSRSNTALSLLGSAPARTARLVEKSEWKLSEANRRAKYYSPTAAGKKQLAAEESKWNTLVATIARVMNPA